MNGLKHPPLQGDFQERLKTRIDGGTVEFLDAPRMFSGDSLEMTSEITVGPDGSSTTIAKAEAYLTHGSTP